MSSLPKRGLVAFSLAVPALAGIAYLVSGEQRSPTPPVNVQATQTAIERAPAQPAPEPPPHATLAATTPERPAPAEPGWEQPDSPESYWQELERLRKEDREQALAYALQGDEWYSDVGKPAEARRAMVVTLLVDLGRMREARERTRAFIAQYPDSPYRRLVQGVTGIHPRPGPPPHVR